MIRFSTRLFVLFIAIGLFSQSCSEEPRIYKNTVGPEDDMTIGLTLDEAIRLHFLSSPTLDYLEPSQHQGAYSYIKNLVDAIENSTNFTGLAAQSNTATSTHIRIIDEPNLSNTNAFVVPGGYIYFYKDFLKKIETEAQFVAVLSHLMACSEYRYAAAKLEDYYSTSFMIDLALGGSVNDVGIENVLVELEDNPYDSSIIGNLDTEAEHTLCELGYDVKSYSDLYTNPNSQNLKWYHLFPRASIPSYANYLYNDLKKSSIACQTGENDGSPEYLSFKNLLN